MIFPKFLFWLHSHWLDLLQVRVLAITNLPLCCFDILPTFHLYEMTKLVHGQGVECEGEPKEGPGITTSNNVEALWATHYLEEDPTEEPVLVKSAARHKDLHLKASVRQRGVITCTGWIFISSERWSQRNEKGKQPSLVFTLQCGFLRPSG